MKNIREIQETYAVQNTADALINNYLFLTFHNDTILNDAHLSRLFFHIERTIRVSFTVSNGKLFDNKTNKEINDFAIYTKDRDGNIRKNMTKIIKKLRTGKNIYEIRINEEYYKHRGLFFSSDKPNSNIQTPNLIFTVGFTKQEGATEDPTTSLAFATNELKEEYHHGQNVMLTLVRL